MNDEIDQLQLGNVLEASKFHKKHHANGKGLKKKISITWQQAKEIIIKKIVVRVLYTAKLCYLLVVTLRVQKK